MNARGELDRRALEGELDRATLERCTRADPLAFRAFVVRYERLVFAVLSRMLGRGSHVEDLAQETFLRAFRAFARFDLDGPARPSTWLVTIATRLAIDARRRDRAALIDDDAEPEVALEPPPRAGEGLSEAIERAAAALSVDQRAVFVLAEFHGNSLAEIAQIVGVPEATVKTRLHRARMHLRKHLAAFEERATGVGTPSEEAPS
ncbi:MAG: RNA polymerase sigma factor [Polyangiaceae bacterium]